MNIQERNMWNLKVIGTGMDVYHLLTVFLIYSVLGWLVESIYMSFCNKKLTNRGFAKGPFCPIYGFGALIGYFVLSPLRKNLIALYLVGAILATTFEFLVGIGMKKLFGEVWWDYNDKPFNYRGLICLESPLAWGVDAIIVVRFLHGSVLNVIDTHPAFFGRYLILFLYGVALVDYFIQISRVLHINWREKFRR